MDSLRSIVHHPLLCLLARVLVGGVFVMYAVDKIAAPADFALNIERYELLPLPIINIIALVLPWIELLVGIFLLFGVNLQASATLAATMLGLFLVAIGSAMARGLEINCGCSARAETVGWGKIIEDTIYLLLAIRIIIKPDILWTVESITPDQQPASIQS